MNEDLYRYEVGTIINENRNTIAVTNSLEAANKLYERVIKDLDDTDHSIVYIYDYDKNANINYYDSEVD